MRSEIYPQFQRWGELGDFDNANSHDFEDFGTQKETKDLILDDLISDSPLETEICTILKKLGISSLRQNS